MSLKVKQKGTGSNGKLISVIIGLVCLDLILLTFAWPAIKQTFPAFFSDKKTNVSRGQPSPVEVSTVGRGAIARKKFFSGVVRALNSAPIICETEGKIKNIAFKEGKEVKKGTILIELDDKYARTAVREASAVAKQKEAQYTRLKELAKRNYYSKAGVEKAESEREAAQADMQKANFALENTKIRAPFDGYMGLRSFASRQNSSVESGHNISVGTFISKNQEVAIIVSLDPVEITFSVPEQDIEYINDGQEIDATIEGYSDLPVVASISAIEPYSDSISHNVRIKAVVKNTDGGIKPGMFARINVSLESSKDSIVIEERGIIQEGGQKYVFTVVDGAARQQSVIVGSKESGKIEIINGLKEGDVYIVDGAGLLVDGYPVRVKGKK